MSRYALPAHDATLTVTVGWDPPLQTFFGQVMRPPTSADEDDVIVAWVGTHRQEIATVAQLCMHLSLYTDIPVATQARLAQDQVESLPPTALQARLVHLLEQVDQQQDPRPWSADLAEEHQSTPQQMRGVVAQWWEAAMLRLAALADWCDGMLRPAHHQRFLDLNSERALADRDLPSQQGPRGAETPDALRQPHALAPVERSEARLVASDNAQRFSVMSPAEHEDWARGGEAASEVERRIWEALQDAGETGRIEVLTPAGAPAFHLDLSAPLPAAQEELMHEDWSHPGTSCGRHDRASGPEVSGMSPAGQGPTHEASRSLLEQIAALRDRLEASPEALQPPRQRDQGMGR
jgi:hypothetical protein